MKDVYPENMKLHQFLNLISAIVIEQHLLESRLRQLRKEKYIKIIYFFLQNNNIFLKFNIHFERDI